MRLHAQVSRSGRSRVVQSDPAQNQSREDEFHRESRQQIRSHVPAEPDVLATEIPEQYTKEWIENAVQNHRGVEPGWRVHCLFLNALSLPDQQPGNEAER